MTAVNVILSPDAAHIVTDGASIDKEGQVAGIVMKAIPLPHMLAALAYSGPAGCLSHFADLAGTVGTSYDDLRAGFARHAEEKLGALVEQHSTAFKFFVAGWSLKHGKPGAFTLDTHGKGEGVTAPAWTAVEIDLAHVLPGGDPRIETEIFPAISEGGFSIEKVAGDLIEIQRSIQIDCALAFGGGGVISSSVGVFAQLTTVTRSEVRTKIVRRWLQDQVGHPLGRKHALGLIPRKLRLGPSLLG